MSSGTLLDPAEYTTPEVYELATSSEQSRIQRHKKLVEANEPSETTTTALTDDSWSSKAGEHRAKGNALFREGTDLLSAMIEYKRALHCLRRIKERSYEKTEKDRAQLYCNLAACALGRDEREAAKRYADRSCRIDPTSVKSFCRRANVYRKYGDLVRAETDFVKALSLAQGDASAEKIINQSLSEVRRAKSEAKEREKRMAAKMFGGA